MRLLIAFDKFKNSLTAAEACELVASIFKARHSDWPVDVCPLSDGGEGFGQILTQSASGALEEVRTRGPRGGEFAAEIGVVFAGSIPSAARAMLPMALRDEDRVGIVEMASASGLELLSMSQRDPWETDSRGTGQLLRCAAEAGVRAILLGVGGSATNDLGLGALAELGVEAVDSDGELVAPITPAQWERISGFRGRLPEGFPAVFIACDVKNPLLGESGCTAVYGPQKGLAPEDVSRMEAGAARVAGLLAAHFSRPESLAAEPGMGAAGGIGFGLRCAGAAQLIPGAEFVAAWLDLSRHLADCDIVLTGEGRFDASSLQGKGPGDLVRRAANLGKQAFVLAGSVEQNLPVPGGMEIAAISPANLPLAEALARGREFLAQAASKIVSRLEHLPEQHALIKER